MEESAIDLLREAAQDIKELRRENELMNAKLEGVEMMAMAVASERHRGPGMPMKPCVVQKIQRHLARAESGKDDTRPDENNEDKPLD